MPIEVLLLFFGGIVGIGGIILVGQRMQYRHLQGGTGPEEGMADALDSLRDEVRLLHDEVAQLNERVEFTERLLSAPRVDDADPDALPDR
jgi:hypothetical protein